MNKDELIAITGQHQLFCGIETHTWSVEHFKQAAQFARAHGVDSLLIKTFDGGNFWYGGFDAWRNIRSIIQNEGVGAIAYGYCYGDKFSAFNTEINYLIAHMQQDGIVCANMETEWDGQVGWAKTLAARLANVQGTFLVSTWANPSGHAWRDVIVELAPMTSAFMPQQYTNYLAACWQQFGINGVDFIQPTVHLGGEFGPNDPVAIAKAAYGQGHTAISVWYHELATQRPSLLDGVYAAFPKTQEEIVKGYSENSQDFSRYWTIDDGKWTCKKFGTILQTGNLAFYKTLSIDGNTLPLIGLPRTNEIAQIVVEEAESYYWSLQFFERALVVYDPKHKWDSQPGCGSSYFGKYEQFMHLDPAYQPQVVEKLPATVQSDLQQIAAIAEKYR